MGSEIGASESAQFGISDASPAGTIALDANGCVTALNNLAADLLGRGRATIVGKPLADFFADDSTQRLEQHFREAAAGGPPARCEVELDDGAGQSRYILMQTLVGATSDPSVAYHIALVDVTSFVARIQESDRARHSAERAAKSKTDFVARLSHEIRSALASMIGFAELLKENVSENNRELTEIIRDSGRHLLDTLNSVMDLARLEYGQGEIEMSAVDVVARVAQRMAMFEKLADARGLDFTFRAESKTALARLNETFLDRVVHNLVENAIKYTPSGKVEVSVEQRDGSVWIYVADTGIGIRDAFLPRLFSPFEREKRDSGAPADGVGLGLTITKYLVELMGGRIVACSTAGAGSTFTVNFPAMEAASETMPPARQD